MCNDGSGQRAASRRTCSRRFTKVPFKEFEHGTRGGGNREGKGYFMLGVYHDQCVRQGSVWRFAYRTFNPLYMGPPDLSAPPKRCPVPQHF